MTNDEKRVPGILVRFSEGGWESTGPLLKITAEVVSITPGYHEMDFVRSYGPFSEYEEIDADATIYAKDSERAQCPFHWAVSYRRDRSDLQELERGLKGLRRALKGMQK